MYVCTCSCFPVLIDGDMHTNHEISSTYSYVCIYIFTDVNMYIYIICNCRANEVVMSMGLIGVIFVITIALMKVIFGK